MKIRSYTPLALALLALILATGAQAAGPAGLDAVAVSEPPAAELPAAGPAADPDAGFDGDVDTSLDGDLGSADDVLLLGSGCFMQYCACELGCRDLSGPEHAACVDQCNAEFQACMGG